MNLSSRKQIILIPQILSTIRLPKRHHPRRIQPARLTRAPRRDPKSKRRVIHTIHHDALMLGAIIAPPTHVGFDDISTVQKGHFAVGLDPNLVAGVFGEDGEGGDVQAEFACLGEFAETDTEGGEFFAL